MHGIASPEFVDPHFDPETGLLRKKADAKTKDALDEAEAHLATARLVQLMDRPVEATGDLDELSAIHRHLLQDIYDWAGSCGRSTLARMWRELTSFYPCR